MSSKDEGRKQALSSVERLLSRNLALDSPSSRHNRTAAVSKRRTAASRRAKKQKEKRQVEIQAQLNPEEYKRDKLWERKRVAVAVTSWDAPDQIEAMKQKILKQKSERKKLISLKKPENWYASSKPAWLDNQVTVAPTGETSKSWPGLTPGLAPVDYEESESEDE